MENVQSPIIPVVGELIRSTPGTISLGQGVVRYPPPPQAIEHIEKFLANPENHKYHPVRGIDPLIEAIRKKLKSENGIIVDPESTLRKINALCRKHNLYHISDEAYEYFTWEGAKHFSPASIEESNSHTISLFSLSKAYGFAGWRIGYMVFGDHLEAAIKKIQDTILICPPWN